MAKRRLIKYAEDLASDPPWGISGGPADEDIMVWNATIVGPQDTPFAGGIFKLAMRFPDDFPFKPPTVWFLSKMFHPNIYASGKICVDILQDQWCPALTAGKILLSIQSLLDDPNPFGPVNLVAADLYLHHREEYNRCVRSTVESSWGLPTENSPLASRIVSASNTYATSPTTHAGLATGNALLVSQAVVSPNPRTTSLPHQAGLTIEAPPIDSQNAPLSIALTGSRPRLTSLTTEGVPLGSMTTAPPIPSAIFPPHHAGLATENMSLDSRTASPPAFHMTSTPSQSAFARRYLAIKRALFRVPDAANVTQTQSNQAASSSITAPPMLSLQTEMPGSWLSGESSPRATSPTGSDDAVSARSLPSSDGSPQADEFHNPIDTASQANDEGEDEDDDGEANEEEEENPHNLETLMTMREPLDLTGEVKILDFTFPAHGGLAVVYRGRWGEVMVAVKVLRFRKQGRANEHLNVSNERRLRREINVWAALRHRNIIEFLGYSADFGDFLAMISPWCEPGTASEHLERQELTIHDRIRLAQDVSEGIQYLHQLNVVHGDLKPTNILVSNEGVAKLCDFGLVRLVDWEGPAGMTTTSPYTGTERYKAPELFASPENRWPVATFEGDIYSLGSIILEFIEGIYPFQRFTNGRDLRIAIADGYPPALRSETTHSLSDMTDFLWNLMEACWNEPTARPSIGLVVGALGTCAGPPSSPLLP